ncbi:MAG: hypothetical protein IBX44_02715 [Sulfurospirillum sp.]|nr:hypothetical protein [Sulfurospirillum sp.]
MKSKIKKLIPQPIKDILRPLKKKFYDDAKKRALFLKMQKKHKKLIEKIKGKEKIKVVFLAIHKSVWKVDPVFKKMLDDSYFEPLILVCPYTTYGEERMWEDMKDTYEYFEEKGYPLLSSYNKDEDRWISLEEIKPDIVFFTNPHNLTRKEYYEDAYMNYLSCYVPYYTDIASNYDVESVYNQIFHNAAWKIFLQSEYSINKAKEIALNKGSNLELSGNLIHEMFQHVLKENIKNPWKQQIKFKKRIIYAPHQSILLENNLHLGTFLHNGEIIKNLAIKYQDSVQWAFKPHTILKSKLYLHPEWGKKRTDEYYDFWQNSDYTQLELGEYIKLFATSDSMIHDCGSFIDEYLLAEKPCGYLYFNGENQLKAINSYGKELLKKYNTLDSSEAIENFIKNIIEENIEGVKFIEDKINPSSLILEQLKEATQK